MKELKDYSYPKLDDEDLQLKIYKKREFNYHRILKREEFKKYEQVKRYREEVCKSNYKAREQQSILKNFLSPETPYKGLLVMHGTGTGKTCTAIEIAEQFKDQVDKYNTKIFILTFGPNNKETFKSELLFCTGNTYTKNKDIYEQMTQDEIERDEKIGVFSALQYYKILSYKSFYRKVLGEKISEKLLSKDNKLKTSYKKKDSGEFEREIVIDKINNMDNSLLIVDEAHNLTGNEYGDALNVIIKNSKNLKVILLTATPMKNLADDIVDLLNFIRPKNDLIRRDEIFTSEKNYEMKLKPNGEEILKKKANGLVSYFRGNMPYTFAKRTDKGEIPNGLLFTHVVKCYMEPFQLEYYTKIKEEIDDSLDRSSSALANFVFPGLDSNNNLTGLYSTDGFNKFLNQLNSDKNKLLNEINKKIFKNKMSKNELNTFVIDQDKMITGSMLEVNSLKKFSIKFYKCIQRLKKLVDDNKGSGTAFIYSNLVKAGGIELFAQCLKKNGYLEYNNNNLYNLDDNTIDATTGKKYKEFVKNKKESEFNPATFLLVTGGGEETDDIPEIKQKIIRKVFNSESNITGKKIKFVLGSKVMNEGVTLENVSEVHILDVHYNLGKVDQVIGRAIRMCKHQKSVNDENRFPNVRIYRYVVALKNKLSSDEILYQKAEKKFILVKKIERILKESAVDCPLLINGNKFDEEIKKFKNCVPPTLENVKKGKKICPALCDFQSCDFKCNNKSLNKEFYDSKKDDYKNLTKKDLDYSSFDNNMAIVEINNIKSQIKDLFRFNHIYDYDNIYKKIISSLTPYQKELFEEKFLYKALNDLSPKNENDFNNFFDTIFDKYSRPGYLIRRDQYFIFQPFDQNEDAPIYYRNKMKINYENQIPVENYVKSNKEFHKIKDKIKDKKDDDSVSIGKSKKEKGYNFDDTMSYYMEREDNFIVGIIDKNLNKLASEDDDLFKIRPPRAKVLEKKRGTGIPTLKGAVCSTSKSKPYLIKLFEQLPGVKKEEIDELKKSTREDVCSLIRDKLMYLEKYSTSSSKNKITYLMIPIDHPKFKFPLNLEDRVSYIVKNLEKMFSVSPNSLEKKSDSFSKKLNLTVKKENNSEFKKLKNLTSFKITLNNINEIKDQISTYLTNEGFNYDKSKNSWNIEIK